MDDRWLDDVSRRIAGSAATRRGWVRMIAAMVAALATAKISSPPALPGQRWSRSSARHDAGLRKDHRKGKRRGRRSAATSAAIAAGWPCSTRDRCASGFSCQEPSPELWGGFCAADTAETDCGVVTTVCETGGRRCCGDLECRVVPGGQSICMPRAKPVGARCSRATECQGGRCRKGRCRCAESLINCGGECVDLQTDARHCGGCGTPCGEEQSCFQGMCAVGGSAGWGWGGTACSFPIDGGICLGWPIWRAAEVPVTLFESSRRGAVSCELFTRRYRCPLCAFGGDRTKCGVMDDPTLEQADRHCQSTENTITLVNCREEQCAAGETLCAHRCQPFDTLCPQVKGSFVPSIDVCTTRPDLYCAPPSAG